MPIQSSMLMLMTLPCSWHAGIEIIAWSADVQSTITLVIHNQALNHRNLTSENPEYMSSLHVQIAMAIAEWCKLELMS
jgi:hypothetical protein